ncbi:hypothetical protein PR202_gb03593 [Eleusine coracana subsp. coracana]|uniref:RRM domain-containing protein n=1 Tax=Eleusine coracana subsp. coracana TaxID=191504 RepID=A0AAV5E284_ELECO|nr:hypothetical protein PR202_gb03593 [Eleusine coracana subsp. coracana]
MLSLNMVMLSKVQTVVHLMKVICHPRTGKSKGYGFVNFSSQDEAAAALRKMNGEMQVLDERKIRVEYANSD